jgi:intein/homing endonuclease
MGYQHIENLYKNQTIFLFKECYALEKIHGCVKDDTIIATINGPKRIKDLKSGDKVYTLNTDTNNEEICCVDNVFIKDDDSKEWFEIETESGHKLIVTSEHYIWLPKLQCYRKVKNLVEGDYLLIK